MPIALMLQANTRALLSGSVRVAVWNELVELEALLVARARGAFLVRWFGTGFPLNGSRLRIAIANLPALRARYLALEAQTRTPEGEGLDIVQPLATLFGGVAGTFLNPLVLLTVLVSGAFKSIWRILTLVGGLLLGPLGAALISLAGPLLLAPLLFSSPKELVEGYPLALAVGALLPPLAAFFGALDANFEAIFGSLLDLAALLGIGDAPSPPGVGLETATKILEGIAPIADQLAVFVPLLFGGLALLIVRVGPLLEPISIVLPAFLRFVVSAVEALGAMFTDIVDGLGMLFDDGKGALKVVRRAFRVLSKAFSDLDKPFSSLFDPLDLVVKDRKSEIAGVFLIFIGEAVVKIKETVVGHPQIAYLIDLVEVIKKLTLDVLRALNRMARSAVEKIGTEVAGPLGGIYATDLYDRLIKKITAPSTTPGFFDKILAKIKAFAISHLEQAIPDHKAILARLTPPLTIAEAFPEKNYSEKEPTIPAELLERHSVFDAERAALLRAARTGSQQ
ncbi:MAG: hypothetical protein HC897_15950, partial [Thermoanaerobaculia bacterium]|nr:hypothetical protein [Thermoanaerobaculia bacterium]